MNVFVACVAASGVLLVSLVVKNKVFKAAAIGLGYGVLLYAAIDAARGVF